MNSPWHPRPNIKREKSRQRPTACSCRWNNSWHRNKGKHKQRSWALCHQPTMLNIQCSTFNPSARLPAPTPRSPILHPRKWALLDMMPSSIKNWVRKMCMIPWHPEMNHRERHPYWVRTPLPYHLFIYQLREDLETPALEALTVA